MKKAQIARKLRVKDIDAIRLSGQRQKGYENDANPEMHAVKNSMRRKGLPEHKIFHHALRQGESYRKKHEPKLGNVDADRVVAGYMRKLGFK